MASLTDFSALTRSVGAFYLDFTLLCFVLFVFYFVLFCFVWVDGIAVLLLHLFLDWFPFHSIPFHSTPPVAFHSTPLHQLLSSLHILSLNTCSIATAMHLPSFQCAVLSCCGFQNLDELSGFVCSPALSIWRACLALPCV